MTDLINKTIRYYPFDETSGTTAADASENENGTATDERVFTSEVAGVINTGADFTQDDDTIATGIETFPQKGAISVWVKSNDTGNRHTVFGSGRGNLLPEIRIALNYQPGQGGATSGRIGVRIIDSGISRDFSANVGAAVNNGNWNHVVIMWDGTSATGGAIYFNNTSQTITNHSNDTFSALDISDRPGFIAGQNDGAFDTFANCEMDEWLFADDNLTTAEIDELYNNGDGFNPFDNGNPTVTTQAPTSVGKTTATHNGNVTDLGEETEVEAGAQFRVKNAETWTDTATQTVTATGAYTTSLTGLDPDTEYEVRSRITWDSGAEEAFGDIEEFETDPLDPPTVTTNAATGITSEGATLNGNLDGLGDYDDADLSFEYKEAVDSEWTQTTPVNRDATGAFSQGVTGLEPDTLHDFRIVAEFGDAERVEGSTLQFTTLEPTAVVVSTQEVTEITQTTATFNGTVVDDDGQTVTAGAQIREQGETEWTTIAGEVESEGAYTVPLTDLELNTTYEVRARGAWDSEETFGAIVEFTTLGIGRKVGYTKIDGVVYRVT